jgi:F-type H+-transporting ATPase subunit delta
MAENSTIARPYAQAVFELAKEQGRLQQWSEMLQLAAMVVADANVKSLIGNPRVDKQQLMDLILGVCGDGLDDNARNFLAVLAENGRLSLLPIMSELYEAYRAEEEKVVQAELISAFPVNEEQQQKIAAALKARLGREVSLNCKTDQSLLGGAIIRAGDMVIDGSVTGHLNSFANALSH